MYNFGLILKDDPRDIMIGSENNEGFIEIACDNWLPYRSQYEMQIGIYFDTKGCATFAMHNQLEFVFNYLIKNKKISEENIDWLKEKGYIDENGFFDCSERFNLILNGTTKNGNYFTKVYQSAFDEKTGTGVIPKSMLPYPRLQRTPVFDWDDFYDESVITDEMRELGREFLRRFTIRYYRVNQNKDNRDRYLRTCPLLCGVRTRCTEKLDCGGRSNHAVVYYTDELKDGWLPVYGSYESRDKDYIRLMPPDYQFAENMRAIKIKENKIMEFIQKKGESAVYKIGTRIIDGKREILPIISGKTYKRVFYSDFKNIEVVDSLDDYVIGSGIGLIDGLDSKQV